MHNLSHLDGLPVIIGGGIAGLMTALRLAPQPVVLLCRAPLGIGTASSLAQGGVAASIGVDDDPALHLADTLDAGDGLCDAGVARRIVQAAAQTIEALARYGVRFDRAQDGALLCGLEAAHSRRRIIHAAGDATGAEIMRALVEAVRLTPSICVLDRIGARRLVAEENAIVGVLCDGPTDSFALATDRVVIATGGVGGLFLETTNPAGSFGQGLALAARAGAELADLEFIQFHPTALDVATRPMALVSEAVRGEGALLVDETGCRFIVGHPGAELAPRDVVARAVWGHLAKGHRVFLDARRALGTKFAARFPTIEAVCRRAGIDPAKQLIPVRPAAHYHMGGIAVDDAGRGSVGGLWACGEAACTGLHGANRLASNSLLEAASTAAWVAQDIGGSSARTRVRRRPETVAKTLSMTPDPFLVRPILSRGIGVMRDRGGLSDAAAALLPFATSQCAASEPAIVGLMIAIAALRREESRGAHSRTDFPQRAAPARRSTLRLDEVFASARELDAPTMHLARRA
jgi:L-aspartate oxidase